VSLLSLTRLHAQRRSHDRLIQRALPTPRYHHVSINPPPQPRYHFHPPTSAPNQAATLPSPPHSRKIALSSASNNTLFVFRRRRGPRVEEVRSPHLAGERASSSVLHVRRLVECEVGVCAADAVVSFGVGGFRIARDVSSSQAHCRASLRLWVPCCISTMVVFEVGLAPLVKDAW
jgi:hypothetical protein